MPDERDISPASDVAAIPARDRGRAHQEGPWRADAHAVVIGINTYLDPKVPDLRFARADAEAVYKVLTDPEVGRFKPENVTLLVDAEATERRIRSALGTALPRRARRDSTVCIYFAGHGAPDIDLTRTSSDGIAKYLIPHDAVADDLRSSGISMDAVQQYFSYLDANQVVCFLDCCYSGAAGGRSFEREGFQTRALLSDEFLDGLASEGRLVITACAASEVSLESQDKGHGLFTYHLVEGLRGAADTGGDGLVTIDELYDYLYHQVERDARSMGGSMKPVRKGSVQGRVYLTEYETTAKKRIRLASEEASAAWARGDVDEASRLWTEVQTLDVGNVAARAGLAQVTERRAQVQAELEEAARRRDEELQRKHQVLLGFFESEQVTPGEYERALGLLDEEVSSLSEIDRRRRRLLDNLIAGSLTLKTYKQSLAAIDRGARKDEPSRPPITAPTPPKPAPSPQENAAPPRTDATMSRPEEPAVARDRPVSPPQPPRPLPPETRLPDDAESHQQSTLPAPPNHFTRVRQWFAVGLGLVVVVMVLYTNSSDTPEPQPTGSSPPQENATPSNTRATLPPQSAAPGTADLGAHLSSDLPPPAWQPTGDRITWKGLSFIVPPGMSNAAKGDLYEMVGLGMRGRGGLCAIVISGEIPSRGDLATHAQALLVGNLAKVGAGIADSHGGSNLIADRRVGRSADGWRYVELNGMVTSGGVERARLMLIEHGATVISIFAISQPGNGCVGLSFETTPNTNTITWLALYYSLKLAGATPSDHLREQIIGRWEGSGMSTAAGVGMLQGEVYASNGRYGDGSLTATVAGQQLPSSGGDGQYVVDADRLATFPNAGKPETHLIRVVEDYSVMTPSKSTIQLCKVRIDVAGPYERCLSRR